MQPGGSVGGRIRTVGIANEGDPVASGSDGIPQDHFVERNGDHGNHIADVVDARTTPLDETFRLLWSIALQKHLNIPI